MKVALVSLLIGLSVTVGLVAEGGIMNEPGYQYNLGAVQGHFKVKPFTDLYTHMRALEQTLSGEDTRDVDRAGNFFMTGLECQIFIKAFAADKYKVDTFASLIKLDSCLGYLYDDLKAEQRRIDIETNVASKVLMERFQSDEKLKAIYYGTELELWSDEIKNCMADVIISNLATLRKYKNTECNTNHLDYLIMFASCQRGDDPDKPLVSKEIREKDTYLQMIYDIVRNQGRRCYEAEIYTINRLSREVYAHSSANRMVNFIGSKISKKVNQEYQRKIPNALARLFHVIYFGSERKINFLPWVMRTFNMQGEIRKDSEFSLKRLSQMMNDILNGDVYTHEAINVKTNEKETKVGGYMGSFLENISNYSTKKYFVKGNEMSNVNEYRKMINNLCYPFRETYSDHYKQFATSFKWLVSMVDFPDVFHISKSEFVSQIMIHGQDTAALYYGVTYCILLDNTSAKVIEPKVIGERRRFKVSLNENYMEALADWPLIRDA